jgi:hypothetical protein
MTAKANSVKPCNYSPGLASKKSIICFNGVNADRRRIFEGAMRVLQSSTCLDCAGECITIWSLHGNVHLSCFENQHRT